MKRKRSHVHIFLSADGLVGSVSTSRVSTDSALRLSQLFSHTIYRISWPVPLNHRDQAAEMFTSNPPKSSFPLATRTHCCMSPPTSTTWHLSPRILASHGFPCLAHLDKASSYAPATQSSVV
jgi:hypothetical protein